MNMDGKICQKVCAACGSASGEYHVNSAELHTLCNNCAYNITSYNFICMHCESNIKIEFLKKVPSPKQCQSCTISPAKKCQSKKHLFCAECRKNFVNCPSCFCVICSKPSSIASTCRIHSYCEPCSKKYNDLCRGCYCQICKQASPLIKFSTCKHPVCVSCYKDSVCLLCEKKCNYCSKTADVGKPICKYHIYCNECDDKLISKIRECAECKNNTKIYKCYKCLIPRYDRKLSCETPAHALCNDCAGSGAKCKCSKCYSCEKILECSETYMCKHNVCSSCKISYKCRKCYSISYECSECKSYAQTSNFFKCGTHNACVSCLNKGIICRKCAKTCDGCRKPKSDCSKQNCEHLICSECLHNNDGNCSICTKCTNCNAMMKRSGDKDNRFCEKCLNDLKKLKMTSCIICKSLVDGKYADCDHNYCKKCMDEWKKLCPICKTCKGCKQVFGTQENISKHIVCKSCLKNNKCCNECMENKVCSICKCLSENLRICKCKNHKICKFCKRNNRCPETKMCINCSELEIGDTMNCEHFMCKMCKNLDPECVIKKECLMCIERCFSCKSTKNLNKIKCKKKEHFLCSVCNAYLERFDCIICSGNLPFEQCPNCIKKNYILKLKCQKHIACLTCSNKDTEYIDDCNQCIRKCSDCNSNTYNSQEYICGDAICEICVNTHVQKCQYFISRICENCGINYIKDPLSCGHKICENCYSTENKCMKCFICEMCNQLENKESQCEHKICHKCLIELGCVICNRDPEFQCSKCKNYEFKVRALECYHKICESCYELYPYYKCDLRICHYCGKCSKNCETASTCGNLICEQCQKYKELESCPKCSNLQKINCSFHNGTEYGYALLCKHYSCIFCSVQECPSSCKYCKKSDYDACKHLCKECLKKLNNECKFCEGYILCDKKHFYYQGQNCLECFPPKCYRCSSPLSIENEENLCSICLNKRWKCHGCKNNFFSDENIADNIFCSTCANSICLICNQFIQGLEHSEIKKCQICIHKEKYSKCFNTVQISEIIEKDKKCFDCSEFFYCKSCKEFKSKLLLEKFGNFTASDNMCLECLDFQQCQSCSNYYIKDEFVTNSQCATCSGYGKCQKCYQHEYLNILSEVKMCRKCAKLKYCAGCNTLKHESDFDNSEKCYKCLGFLQCILCKNYKHPNNLLENRICKECPKTYCRACNCIFDKDFTTIVEICPNCCRCQCLKCSNFVEKNQISKNGICIECSSFGVCTECGDRFTENTLNTHYSKCLNCANKTCNSCFNFNSVKLMVCNHLECDECKIPNSTSCSKCSKIYRCSVHNSYYKSDSDENSYIYLNCCDSFYCKNCKAQYPKEGYGYIEHKKDCSSKVMA